MSYTTPDGCASPRGNTGKWPRATKLAAIVGFSLLGCSTGTRQPDRQQGTHLGRGGTTASIEDCSDGSICYVADATCVTADSRVCTCHGPEGSRFLFCESAGNAGAAGALGAGGKPTTFGSGGSAGQDPNLKIWGGNGGATAPSAEVGRPCTGAPPWDPSLVPAVQLSVDVGTPEGPWDRFHEMAVAADHANTVLASAWGRNIQGALKKGHDEAGFRYVRFHGILDGDIGVYQEVDGNPVYDFARFDAVFDAIKAAGMRPIFEVSFTPPPLATNAKKTLHWYNGVPANISIPKDWGRWGDLMAALVTHLEERYGADEIRQNWFFEIWNEPSWMYEGNNSGYQTLYQHTVEGLLRADPQLRVGGPAESSMASAGAISTLANYCKNSKVQLDFVTYHVYANDGDSPTSPVPLARARSMLAFHKSMVDTAKQLKFTGLLLNTEWGPTFSTQAARDSEISASFVAKTIHLIGTDPSYPPPYTFAYWTLSDIYEEISTGKMLAYREGNYGLLLRGDVNYPESYDLAKPAFNAFRILHLLGDTRLKTAGGTSADGVGAQGTVTTDGRSVRVMVYNHTDDSTADPASGQVVGLTINNVPFAPGPVRIRHYVVDKTHSNSYTTWREQGRPQQPTPEQWAALKDSSELCYYETTAELADSTFTAQFAQNNYSVGLVVVTPLATP